MLLKDYKFTDEEKKLLDKNLVVLVDSREKKNEHILNYFDTHHINYKKQALSSGDYSFYIQANEQLSIPNYNIYSEY
jgi:ERCC4-type nuclease